MSGKRPTAGTPAIVALTAAGVQFAVHEFHHEPGERHYGVAAAQALGIDPDQVFKTLVTIVHTASGEEHVVGIVPVSGQMSLREIANGDCTFLDGRTRRCTIYPVRPAQCRTWPFWNSNLESPEAWDRAKSVCPGMGQGPLVPLQIIEQQASVVNI